MARAVAANTRNGQSRRRDIYPIPSGLTAGVRSTRSTLRSSTASALLDALLGGPGTHTRPRLSGRMGVGPALPGLGFPEPLVTAARCLALLPRSTSSSMSMESGLQAPLVLSPLSLPRDPVAPPLWASGTPLRPVPGPSDRQRCPRRRRRPRLRRRATIARSPQCHRSGISRVFSKLRAILGRVSVSCKAKARS